MDDAAFLQGFEARTLPQFHHRDHIRLTWLYLRRDGLETGSRRIIDGLRALAAAHGADAKYNETLTRFWIDQVAAALAAVPVPTFEAFIQASPDLMDRQLALKFYRGETLASPEARTGWLEPDLAPRPSPPPARERR